MHEHLIKWLSDIIKKTVRGVPHMLAPRRDCFGYSEVYCNFRKRWFLAWNQNMHILYNIFHIQYTHPKISIGLLYIRPHFVWWHRLGHSVICRPPILVRTSVSLLTFHTSYILVPLWFTNVADSRIFPFPRCVLSCMACSYGIVEAVEHHRRFSGGVWKKDICKY